MQLTGQKAVIVTAVGFFLVGLLIGWLVIGWWAWPVQYYDTEPYDLRQDHKLAYVAMVADSYTLTGDLKAAQQRLQGWPKEELTQILSDQTTEHIRQGRGTEAQRLTNLMTNLGIQAPSVAAPIEVEETARGKATLGTVLAICGILVAIVLVVAGGALGWSYLQKRKVAGGGRPAQAARVSEEYEEPIQVATPASYGAFVTTYNLGDDSYDDCFPIETAQGEFLGECGVGVSEVIGEDTPSLVTAFEVWLFDKSDIRTVTKVLMSDFAYHDPELHDRLSSKGELILTRPGTTLVLETATLKVQAHVQEMAYGAGEGPEQSHFARLTTELVASARDTSASDDLIF